MAKAPGRTTILPNFPGHGRMAMAQAACHRHPARAGARGRDGHATRLGEACNSSSLPIFRLKFPPQTADDSVGEVCPGEKLPAPPIQGLIGGIDREDEGKFAPLVPLGRLIRWEIPLPCRGYLLPLTHPARNAIFTGNMQVA